jgi:hypothetical protein
VDSRIMLYFLKLLNLLTNMILNRKMLCEDQTALQSTVRDIKSSDDHSG